MSSEDMFYGKIDCLPHTASPIPITSWIILRKQTANTTESEQKHYFGINSKVDFTLKLTFLHDCEKPHVQ